MAIQYYKMKQESQAHNKILLDIYGNINWYLFKVLGVVNRFCWILQSWWPSKIRLCNYYDSQKKSQFYKQNFSIIVMYLWYFLKPLTKWNPVSNTNLAFISYKNGWKCSLTLIPLWKWTWFNCLGKAETLMMFRCARK